MYILSVKGSRQVDNISINDYNFPSEFLMENAGRSITESIQNEFGSVENRVCSIISGKGNNGGDGIVIARHLYNAGAKVNLILLTSPSNLKGDPKTNFNIIKNYDIKIIVSENIDDWKKNLEIIKKSEISVDAIFGTGFKGKLKGFYRDVVKDINLNSNIIVSVDVPSGVNGDNINPESDSIRADLTIALANYKMAHVFPPAENHSSKSLVGNIGIPPEIIIKNALFKLIDLNDFSDLFAQRESNSHKGTFGHTVILGGSKGKSGAISMAALAALRSGTGLVTIASPESIVQKIASFSPEIMYFPLEEEKGMISKNNYNKIIKFLFDKDSLVIGPGMDTSEDLKNIILKIINNVDIPVVVDADGLNNLGPEIQKIDKKNIVYTPHPGEFKRISNFSKKEIKENRWLKGIEFAKKYNLNLVLKGYKTLVCFGNQKTGYINPTGNPGMASGGTGDVLSGILGAFLSLQDTSISFDSRILGGVFIHSLAGDLASIEIGEQSLIATDILDFLPKAFCSLKNEI